MKWQIQTKDVTQQSCDALVVYFTSDSNFSPSLKQLDAQSKGYFSTRLKEGDLPAKGDLAVFPAVTGIKAKRVVVCHLKDGAQETQSMGRKIAQIIGKKMWKNIAFAFSDQDSVFARLLVSAMALEMYRFSEFKTLSAHEKTLQAQKRTFYWHGLKEDEKFLDEAFAWLSAWNEGMHLMRHLANMPANVCTPSYLAQTAKDLEKNYTSIKTQVLKTKEMQAMGMGALLAVAQGAQEQPRLITMSYKPKNAQNKKPLVFVGKGVTFDTGGISIKPSAEMDLMKYDMTGAASVFGLMNAIALAKLPLYVVGVVPAVENMPDGGAIKPGDIVRSLSGKTIEILNTDAEGRLILCDALTYAQKTFKPELIIDIATLTGACSIALGGVRAGLFGNSDELQDDLFTSGERTCDRVWKMPVDSDYRRMMDSPFADIANLANARGGGASSAAAFLQEFIEDCAWAHLDIAGVAWNSGANKGASGRPLAMLFDFLTQRVKR